VCLPDSLVLKDVAEVGKPEDVDDHRFPLLQTHLAHLNFVCLKKTLKKCFSPFWNFFFLDAVRMLGQKSDFFNALKI
jgi:hypothetical protein